MAFKSSTSESSGLFYFVSTLTLVQVPSIATARLEKAFLHVKLFKGMIATASLFFQLNTV